ncbi:MAG: glycosyltransferase family 2 protein [Deferribacteraceae bacterium]|jgi:glycosyltransferase involved in cell wall biosynthesis|nr:glycosyltransferase family 2 protein [Deferribacteraceae bacterium]
MLVTFVIPCLNEDESLRPLYTGIVEQFNGKDEYRYEIMFIDDGSTDGSLSTIKQLAKDDSAVRYISFRKNMGKAIALQTGFNKCTNSDIIITMDADLQDDPSEIFNFIGKIEEGYDLVSGWKYNRLDPLEKRLPSKLFNKTISMLSGVKLHDFNCGFKAYRAEVVRSVNIYGELHRFIPVLANRSGFKIAEITVKHNKRQFGKSKYGWERYFRGLLDAISVTFISRFYHRPMYLFGKLGLTAFLMGTLICVFLFVQWLAEIRIGDRPLLLLGVLLIIFGAQLVSTGLICNLVIESNFKSNYSENYIKEES